MTRRELIKAVLVGIAALNVPFLMDDSFKVFGKESMYLDGKDFFMHVYNKPLTGGVFI